MNTASLVCFVKLPVVSFDISENLNCLLTTVTVFDFFMSATLILWSRRCMWPVAIGERSSAKGEVNFFGKQLNSKVSKATQLICVPNMDICLPRLPCGGTVNVCS